MKSDLLNDHCSIEEAKAIQLKYNSEVQNPPNPTLGVRELRKIEKIVGVDISYLSKRGQEFGIACAVLWNLREERVIEKAFAQDKINFPYIAGYLGFRECPLLAKALEKLSTKYDVVMCDGHGKIHPRRFGEAVQLGLTLNIPTIGIAKSPFIGYSDWKTLQRKKGAKRPIWNEDPRQKKKKDQELLGYAICLRDGSKPVFVSEGYRIDINLALMIALKTSGTSHRQPEPLYYADLYSKQKVPSSQ